jgi:transcriptional regulator with XRE-family HTH domain
MPTKEEIAGDLLRLRNYIQEWLDANNMTWTALMAKAGHANGMASTWRNLKLRTHPRPETLRDVAAVMGVPYETLMTVAGVISAESPRTARTERGYRLSPRESKLVDSFRSLDEHYKSIVYNQIVGMAEAVENRKG